MTTLAQGVLQLQDQQFSQLFTDSESQIKNGSSCFSVLIANEHVDTQVRGVKFAKMEQ